VIIEIVFGTGTMCPLRQHAEPGAFPCDAYRVERCWLASNRGGRLHLGRSLPSALPKHALMLLFCQADD
jgi:hypothetical protein